VHHVILWAGFLGAWLLVAGPVYQASLELRDEQFERDRFAALAATVPAPPPVSPWWWLLPPVRLMLAHRRTEQHQRAMVVELEDADWAALNSYLNKATGWMLVAAGGFLIATKETYELIAGNEWSEQLIWALVPGMVVIALGYTAARSARDARSDQLRRDARAEKAAGPNA
jgi:hypothetical protein